MQETVKCYIVQTLLKVNVIVIRLKNVFYN